MTGSTTRKGYEQNREEFLSVPYTVIAGSEGWTDLSTVYNFWDEKYERENSHYLWEALNEMYHAGILEVDEFLGGTKLKIDERYHDGEEILDALPELSGEYADGVWTRTSEEPEKLEFGGVEFPDLPWDVFEEHASRHEYSTEEIHRGEMEGVVAEKESETGDKLARYAVANRPDRDRIGLSVLFRVPEESAPGNDDLFSERHRQNYLDRIWQREINPMRQRSAMIYGAAEEALEELDAENSYVKALGEHFRRVTGLKPDWTSDVDQVIAESGADLDEQIDRIVEMYYPEEGSMGNVKPDPVIMNWSELMESDEMTEGLMPLGESLGDSKTAEGNRRRNRLYLEKYLESLVEMAEEKDRN